LINEFCLLDLEQKEKEAQDSGDKREQDQGFLSLTSFNNPNQLETKVFLTLQSQKRTKKKMMKPRNPKRRRRTRRRTRKKKRKRRRRKGKATRKATKKKEKLSRRKSKN